MSNRRCVVFRLTILLMLLTGCEGALAGGQPIHSERAVDYVEADAGTRPAVPSVRPGEHPSQTSPDAPAVETPPADAPPVEAPGETPPVDAPDETPAETPPVDPPAETPPAETPPAETPPVETPATGCGEAAGTTLRTLFVGNSQIYWSDLPHMVAMLGDSAPESCPRIDASAFTQGGANLRDLWENIEVDGRRLPEAIASGDYDVVVIAESIDLVELVPEPYPGQFVDYATQIVEAVRDAGAVPVLYATPYVETDDHSGFHEMADPQIALAREDGARLAAGGLAWLRVYDERPGIDLYAEDRAHPGVTGTYVSALVVYAAITGANPIGLARADGMSSDDAALFQRAARAQQMATGF